MFIDESTRQFAHLQYLFIMTYLKEMKPTTSFSLVMPCLDVKNFPHADCIESIRLVLLRIKKKNLLYIVSNESLRDHFSYLTLSVTFPIVQPELDRKKSNHLITKENEYKIKECKNAEEERKVEMKRHETYQVVNKPKEIESQTSECELNVNEKKPKITIDLSDPDSILKIQYHHLKKKLNL